MDMSRARPEPGCRGVWWGVVECGGVVFSVLWWSPWFRGGLLGFVVVSLVSGRSGWLCGGLLGVVVVWGWSSRRVYPEVCPPHALYFSKTTYRSRPTYG